MNLIYVDLSVISFYNFNYEFCSPPTLNKKFKVKKI